MFMQNNTLTTSVDLDIDLQSTDETGTHTVNSMQEMFKDCTALKTVTLKADNFDKVTNFTDMFSGCNALETVVLEGKSGTANIDISGMFQSLPNLKSVTINGFNITNAVSAFQDCSSLEISTVNRLNYSQMKSTESMYQGCTGLKGEISISDLSNSVSTKNMFSGCTGDETGNITSLSIANAPKVEDISGIIDGISTLETISLTGFDKASFGKGFLTANQSSLANITIEGNLSTLSTFRSILTNDDDTTTKANNTVIKFELMNTAQDGETAFNNATDVFHNWTALETVTLSNFQGKNGEMASRCLQPL